jgi:mRNA-degrading endonuclease RelE of RelBE toxin-antitoxin system
LSFEAVIDEEAVAFINSLDTKSRRLVGSHLKSLEENPYPGIGGDKELMKLRPGVRIYRLHIGRSFTAFYQIEGNTIFITEVMTIEQAHKKYKLL